LAAVRSLGALRAAHPALRTGRLRMVWADADAVAFTRESAAGHLLVVIDRGSEPRPISLPVASARPETVFGRAECTPGESLTVAVAAPGAAVVVL